MFKSVKKLYYQLIIRTVAFMVFSIVVLFKGIDNSLYFIVGIFLLSLSFYLFYFEYRYLKISVVSFKDSDSEITLNLFNGSVYYLIKKEFEIEFSGDNFVFLKPLEGKTKFRFCKYENQEELFKVWYSYFLQHAIREKRIRY